MGKCPQVLWLEMVGQQSRVLGQGIVRKQPRTQVARGLELVDRQTPDLEGKQPWTPVVKKPAVLGPGPMDKQPLALGPMLVDSRLGLVLVGKQPVPLGPGLVEKQPLALGNTVRI